MKQVYNIQLRTSIGNQDFLLLARSAIQGKQIARASLLRQGVKVLGVNKCIRMKGDLLSLTLI